MNRRLLIAGNWKMHGGLEMTTELISGISRRVLDAASMSEQRGLAYDILVCPPTPYLSLAQHDAQAQPIALGAQNVSAHSQGAHTGEVSLAMLAEFACEYVLLGHSERRELYGESDSDIAAKFAACVEYAVITPILCVGESLDQRESGETENVVSAQLDAVLELVGIDGFSNAVIAYEPVWAIGTGKTATPEQAQFVHEFIRDKMSELDPAIADQIRILYGGSMKPDNAHELLVQKDIDGGLIGGASLKVDSFASICEMAQTLSNH